MRALSQSILQRSLSYLNLITMVRSKAIPPSRKYFSSGEHVKQLPTWSGQDVLESSVQEQTARCLKKSPTILNMITGPTESSCHSWWRWLDAGLNADRLLKTTATCWWVFMGFRAPGLLFIFRNKCQKMIHHSSEPQSQESSPFVKSTDCRLLAN